LQFSNRQLQISDRKISIKRILKYHGLSLEILTLHVQKNNLNGVTFTTETTIFSRSARRSALDMLMSSVCPSVYGAVHCRL